MDLEYHFLIFRNLDLEWFRDGWIVIKISINIPLSNDPEPNGSEPNDYSTIIIIVGSIFAIIIVGAVVILSKRKNERINQNTQDSKAVQKYRISPTIQESKVVGNYCQNCGQKNTIPNSKFCVNCGDNLNI
ncbi:MAG: zinc ribbon domain-containing protein, partial [Patescibacteria group bacterium]|nr:zinc ribbon domain-containing protein [Patescibacteria group bacterium]